MIQKLNLTEKPDWIGASWGVVDAVMEGDESIEHLCQTWGMSQGIFYRTTMKHPELKEAFGLARKIRAQRYVDQAIQLTRPATDENGVSLDWGKDQFDRYTANTGLINRDALRIKTLLHLAAKLDPEQFGDRIIQDQRGDGKAMLVIGNTEKAAELIAQARKRALAAPDEQAGSGSTTGKGSDGQDGAEKPASLETAPPAGG